MSYKTQPLLSSELVIDKNKLFYEGLMNYCKANGKSNAEVTVLDWGCGRGRFVGFLLSEGFNAYGVDIDPLVVSQAQGLFAEKGWDFPSRMFVIKSDNRSPFPDKHFDFICSDQVFEHVQDIRSLANELLRITKKGGQQFHRWPAKFRVIEPHLFMPIVHWIPKTFVRDWAIFLFVLLGIEPHWKEVNEKGILTKSAVYSAYSRKKTFYRSLNSIQSCFGDFALQDFSTQKLRLRSPFKKLVKVLRVDKWLGLHFNSVILRLIR